MHRFQDLRIAAHAQIIIGAPDCHFVFFRLGVGERKLSCETIDVVEQSVGLVTFLRYDLIVEESIVVEDRRCAERLKKS